MQARFVNDTLQAHLAREIAGLTGTWRRLAGLAILAAVIGLLGPFGTFAVFAPLERHLYWALVVFGTTLTGHGAFAIAGYWGARHGWPMSAHLAAGAVLGAVPVAAVVLLIGTGFGFTPGVAAAGQVYLQCAAILSSIAVAGVLLGHPRPPDTAEAQRPALLDRLPGARRGRLLRLSAQDHYVEVVTDRGNALVQMRLRDAIAETSPEPGAQIHRSHWVALSAVTGRCTADGRRGIRLTDGSFVPVGRTFRESASRAGIL